MEKDLQVLIVTVDFFYLQSTFFHLQSTFSVYSQPFFTGAGSNSQLFPFTVDLLVTVSLVYLPHFVQFITIQIT